MSQHMQSYAYADDLFGFPRFPDAVREASRFPIKQGTSMFVPERDDAYVFRKEHLRVIQFWAADQGNMAFDEPFVKIRARICRAVGGDQQFCSVEVRRLCRNQSDLNGPL